MCCVAEKVSAPSGVFDIWLNASPDPLPELAAVRTVVSG
jgi:hypothetical protein